jgi:hypothetical protein
MTRQINAISYTNTNQNPVINYFERNLANINSGQAVTLTWSSTNSSYCNISGGNTNLYNQSTSGSTTVYPTATTNYSIICYGTNGQSSSANVTVNVNYTTTTVTNVNISASPNPISSGQIANLTWYSSGANYCNLTGGNLNISNQPTSGSYAVSPAIATNYTVTCYNNNGQNASAYVYVTTSNNSTSSANSGTNTCQANGQNYAHNSLVTIYPYSSVLPTRCCNGLFWGPLGNIIGAPECSSSYWQNQTGHSF